MVFPSVVTFTVILLHNDRRIEIYCAGRSNAINIAERLGLPGKVVDNARELYGAASAGIDEVTCVAFLKFYSKSLVFFMS